VWTGCVLRGRERAVNTRDKEGLILGVSYFHRLQPDGAATLADGGQGQSWTLQGLGQTMTPSATDFQLKRSPWYKQLPVAENGGNKWSKTTMFM